MKNLLIFLIAIAIISCDNSDNQVDDYYFIDSITFSIFNSQNEDLLNPVILNNIDAEGIKLFYRINGENKEVYNPNLDYPRNIIVNKPENDYIIRILPNYSPKEEKSITYIQWNDKDTDTLEVMFKNSQYGILNDEIWLNGKQIWDHESNTEPYFKLIK